MNLAKLGIDFTAAQALWDDENYLEVQARTQDEPRWLVIGKIGDRTWASIVTRRRGVVRIISVRRARAAEEALHEGS
ncbi:MAG: BrnT family toxin [Actinomycetales bacterium]|nr:BrnT family toxin [Actinomycetales bacterium]